MKRYQKSVLSRTSTALTSTIKLTINKTETSVDQRLYFSLRHKAIEHKHV